MEHNNVYATNLPSKLRLGIEQVDETTAKNGREGKKNLAR